MANMDSLFDPATYAKVRRPLTEASHLPPACYTSQAFYEREVETIFAKVWNFVGRADRIPEPGDYFTLDFTGVPVIVLRGRDGVCRAFANSCRHRGARLLSGEGNARTIGCPYHGWSYGLDGRLVAAPGMEGIARFKLADHGLRPLRLESWQGFLFLNFDPGAEDLASYLGNLPEVLGGYNFADMRCTRRAEFELACNWKLYIENAMEEYHTAVVHRASIKRQIATPVATRGQWEAAHVAMARSIAVLDDAEAVLPHIEGLAGPAAEGTYFVLLYPGTMWGCTQDCMWWLELHPLAADRTRLTVGSCFPTATIARDDFDTAVAAYYRRWDKSIPEDNAISEIQQLGLASPLATTGRVSLQERLVHQIANWVLDRVL